MIKFQTSEQTHGLIFERLISHVPDSFSRFATTGYSKNEAFNRPLVTTSIVPKQRESVQKIFVDALHGNETSNCELEFRTKSGETCFLLINATRGKDSENNVIGVVGVVQDGTEAANHIRLCSPSSTISGS